MRATPYNSISEPCDEPGIGSPVQKSTPQFTTPGRRLSNGARNKSIHLGAWTLAKVEILTRRWLTHSASQIGQMVGLTRSAVLGKANRLSLPTKKQPAKPPRTTPPVLRGPKARASFKSAPLPRAVKLALPLHAGIALMALEPHHCRWPVGDPHSSDFGFCGSD